MNRMRFAVLGMVQLALLTGCHGSAGGSFKKGEEPKVEFFQLDLANRTKIVTDAKDAVEIGFKITNRTDAPIELIRVRLQLAGQVVAQVEPQYENMSQQIPSNDARIVRVRMLLRSAQNPSTSGGPMIPTLRGQLYFKTAQGILASAVNEKLSDVGDTPDDQ